MPAIDTDLLLDLLLGAIVLLFVPFGVRRGVAKEAMVSGGILLGAALAGIWADRAGDELANWLGLGTTTSRFTVATAAVIAGAVVLGYGGGAALGRLNQGILARLAGGLLAAFNGALLLAYVLGFVERHLRPGRDIGEVDDGYVGWALLREFDWVLLAAAAILAVCVLLGLVVTGFRRRNERGTVDAGGGAIPPRQRPVRVPRDVDAGKYEPTIPSGPSGGIEPRPGRFGGGQSGLGQTTPLPDPPQRWRIDDRPEGETESWPRPRAIRGDGAAANGHAAPSASAGEWLRRTDAAGQATATDIGRLDDRVTEAGGSVVFGGNGAGVGGAAAAGATDRRCPACGALAGPRDHFCPECGTTL